jgi:hypothetical protein
MSGFGIGRDQSGQPHWQNSLHSLIALRSTDYENWSVVLETIHASSKAPDLAIESGLVQPGK